MARKRRKPKHKEQEKAKQKVLKLKDYHFIFLFLIISLSLFHAIVPFSKMVLATDQITGGIFFREFEARTIKIFHQFPFWEPYLFSGMPFIDAMHGDLFYITALFRLIFPTHVVLNYAFILHVFLAGVTAFYLFSYLMERKIFAFLFALSYMLSANMVSLTYSGHDGKIAVMALFPLFILWTLKGLRTGKLRFFMLNSTVLGYATFSLHIQMLYYSYLFLGLLWFFETIHFLKEDKKYALKISIYFALMILLSLGIATLRFVPINYYVSKFSPRAGHGRGYEFAKSWALPWEDYISAFIPGFSGFMSQYWGHNPFKINSEYIGFFAWLTAIFSIFFAKKDRFFYFLLTAFIFFSLIALGGSTPLFRLFYEIMPGFKKFRAHSMSFFTVNMSILMLGILGIKGFLESESLKETLKKLYYVLALVFAIFLVFGPLKGLYINSLVDPNKIQAFYQVAPNITTIVLKVTAFAALSLLFFYMFKTGNLNEPIFAGLTVILILLDLWPVDSQFIKAVPEPSKYYPPDEAVEFLKKDNSIYRVFPLFYRIDNNYLMWYDIESIGGHHGNQFKRYQEFLGASHTIMFRPFDVTNLYRYPYFLNLLNAKYILTQPIPEDLSNFSEPIREKLLEIVNFLKSPWIKEVYRSSALVIYENTRVLPRAFCVQKYRVLPGQKVLEFMESPEFDYKNMVVLEKEPDFKIVQDTSFKYEIKFLKKTPNMVKLEVKTNGPAFLVYSANYYPYMKCKVNGKRTEVFQADYILRAVPVEKGTHIVEFYYDTSLYKKSGFFTLLSLLIALILAVI